MPPALNIQPTPGVPNHSAFVSQATSRGIASVRIGESALFRWLQVMISGPLRGTFSVPWMSRLAHHNSRPRTQVTFAW